MTMLMFLDIREVPIFFVFVFSPKSLMIRFHWLSFSLYTRVFLYLTTRLQLNLLDRLELQKRLSWLNINETKPQSETSSVATTSTTDTPRLLTLGHRN
jgi:hypothetical protein